MHKVYNILADLIVSKRLRASYQLEIHFAVVNHLYLLFSFVYLDVLDEIYYSITSPTFLCKCGNSPQSVQAKGLGSARNRCKLDRIVY